MIYLCYDLKGIQSYIFQIPRLRYIVGGSIVVDRFDREIVPERVGAAGARLLFAAGGKGAVACDDDAGADRVRDALVGAAREHGLAISFGRAADFAEAAHCASELYPALPDGEALDGPPCPVSGCYPVPDAEREHAWVRGRLHERGEALRDRLERRVLDGLDLGVVGLVADNGRFFHEVDREAPVGAEPRAAFEGLGGRGRWAVVTMDGNDMGAQFTAATEAFTRAEDLVEWIDRMSQALDDCSLAAAQAGCAAVVRDWAHHANNRLDRATLDGRQVVLPLRPLVVGGDDLIVLCHAHHAMAFVRAACERFAERAAEHEISSDAAGGSGLWLATGGRITISAGILYCGDALPLHAAVPYAESLLASAKGRGRSAAQAGVPSPACVDFESVTESMLDTPTARRHRELTFRDADLAGNGTPPPSVRLTRRPFTLTELDDVQVLADSLANVPRSVLHRLLPGLRAGLHDRRLFTARLGKRQSELARLLAETASDAPEGSRWRVGPGGDRATDVLDAVLLAEEAHRGVEARL